jgi:hypothetical protein
MLHFIPTQLVTLAACESAFADLCVQPAPPTPSGQSSSMISGGAGAQTLQRIFRSAAFLARSTVSAYRKSYSIPIHPPR